MSTLWTRVTVGSPTWRRDSDGVMQQRLPAVAYPVGTRASTCEAATSSCHVYDVVEHVWTEGPAIGKTQAWRKLGTGELLPWFAATEFSDDDTVMIGE